MKSNWKEKYDDVLWRMVNAKRDGDSEKMGIKKSQIKMEKTRVKKNVDIVKPEVSKQR